MFYKLYTKNNIIWNNKKSSKNKRRLIGWIFAFARANTYIVGGNFKYWGGVGGI